MPEIVIVQEQHSGRRTRGMDVKKMLCTQGAPRATEAALSGAVLGYIPLHAVLEAFANTGCRHLLRCFPDTRMAPAMDHVGDCSGVATERLSQRGYGVPRGMKFSNAKDLLGS